MSNAINFKKAHKLARQTMQAGDNYRAVFAECLKQVIADSKKTKTQKALSFTLNALSDKSLAYHAGQIVSAVGFKQGGNAELTLLMSLPAITLLASFLLLAAII